MNSQADKFDAKAHEAAKSGDVMQADRFAAQADNLRSGARSFAQAANAPYQNQDQRLSAMRGVGAQINADQSAIESGKVDDMVKGSYAQRFPQQYGQLDHGQTPQANAAKPNYNA